MEVGVSVVHFLVNFSRVSVSSEILAIKNPKNHIRTNDGFHKNNDMQILTAWVKVDELYLELIQTSMMKLFCKNK